MSGGSRQAGFFTRFVHSEVAGSVVLLATTLIALLWANSAWGGAYERFIHTGIGVSLGARSFSLSVHYWVNDGLMVLFFFVVGLEIKREVLLGELSSRKKAILPVMAAAGGMIVPALIYSALNFGGAGSRGWGIPMATDIAFALGILAIFGKRVPIGLKVFLTALAIADDLGAVLVIALFYTSSIEVLPLLAAAVCLALLAVAGRKGIRRPGIYLILFGGVWLGVFLSGIHSTVAGILVAMLVPVRSRIDPRRFLEIADRRVAELKTAELTRESLTRDREQFDAIEELSLAANRMLPSGLVLERYCHPLMIFLILPLFALCNAGVHLGAQGLSSITHPVSLGVLLGLFLGKQIGVFSLAALAIRKGWAEMPRGVTFAQIYGVSLLAGIGFTMSLFVGGLAFTDAALMAEAKIGILAGSILSGLAGALFLRRVLPRGATPEDEA